MMSSTLTRLLHLEALTGQWLHKQRQDPPYIVVYVDDHESSAQAIQRVLGRAAHPWETVLLVEYAPPLPEA